MSGLDALRVSPRAASLVAPPKIIAEIGLAHEGSLGLALSMARAAVEAGAHIVKFQMHFPEMESSSLEGFRVMMSGQDQTRWDYWERTAFSLEEWKKLKIGVESAGGIFAVSVFSAFALDFARQIDTTVLKFGSGDLGNSELLENAHDFSGTILLSTGMATWREVQTASQWIKGAKCNDFSAILQCTSMYPTDLMSVGINVMEDISTKLGIKSGLSDHSPGINASIVAAVRGATYVEKHVIFSPEMHGPDVSSSITFAQLKRLSQFIMDLDALNTPVNKDAVSLSLSSMRVIFGRSLALKKNFPAGYAPALSDFCLRKPSGGLDWAERLHYAGRKLSRPYEIQDLLTPAHFD